MGTELRDEDSFSELSSDEELQRGLAEGTLKPGLIGEIAPPRTFTNNVSGLREALSALKRKGPSEWLERMDVTCHTVSHVPTTQEEDEEQIDGKELDPNDDFKREMWFYEQAQSAVVVGLRKLEELEIPTTRPEDYFAEMVKTDDHMRKVRERLLSRQKGLEQKEKARKLRELKKFGKKVQQDILQKRREEKKNAMKSFKKGKPDNKLRITTGKGRKEIEKEEEEFAVSTSRKDEQVKKAGVGKKKRKGASIGNKSKKRQFKDQKFGLGGKKHGQKRNSSQSSADMTGFSSARHSKTPTKTRKQRRKK